MLIFENADYLSTIKIVLGKTPYPEPKQLLIEQARSGSIFRLFGGVYFIYQNRFLSLKFLFFALNYFSYHQKFSYY